MGILHLKKSILPVVWGSTRVGTIADINASYPYYRKGYTIASLLMYSGFFISVKKTYPVI